jgi:hypothetical protein
MMRGNGCAINILCQCGKLTGIMLEIKATVTFLETQGDGQAPAHRLLCSRKNMFMPFESPAKPALAPMTNADIDACAWLLCSAGARKHVRNATPWTRVSATQHLSEVLSAPGVRAFVWRDARCAPVAFVAGEMHGECFQVISLCVSRHVQADGFGLRLVQQVQREIGAGHVELAESLSGPRARQILKSL